ncbi:O-antigen ligase family protein [Aeromonas jandaei]|uniref:O-antigen ligase family protein n=1 Tax=Aeromonas jandaei TaxID=650 RepID=UPI001C5BA02D|nr:O-antigen ligase family protein [Aeromonas jandaei]MBW3762379.1 O-antigen ligase family protein [Aeromonas jandaei]
MTLAAKYCYRLSIVLCSLTLFFTLCGLFIVPLGPHYLTNLLVFSSVVGVINYFVGNKALVGVSARNLYWCVLIYIIAIGISRLVHDDESWLIRNLLYILAFFLLMPREPVLISAFRLGSLVGGIAIGLLAMWQYHNGMLRVEGFTNAILFAQGALILAILNGFFAQESSTVLTRYSYIVSATLAISAIYLSQSRGVWLALIVVVTFVLIAKAIKEPIKYLSWLLILSCVLAITFYESDMLRTRIHESISEVNMMESNNYTSSWGLRLMAWKSAWTGFIDHPLLGVGLDGVKPMRQQQLLDGIVNDFYVSYGMYHAHNQFMQNMVIRGIVGLLAALAILVYPMRFFWCQSALVSVGFIITLGTFVCALTDVPIEHQNTLYIYLISLFFICFKNEGRFNDKVAS